MFSAAAGVALLFIHLLPAYKLVGGFCGRRVFLKKSVVVF